MNDTFSRKTLIVPALLVAALGISLHSPSNSTDADGATLQSGAGAVIVTAGNTPPPPPPRLTYKMAKDLGFVKPGPKL